MNDVDDLIRQRDELDRRIIKQQDAARGAFEDALYALENKVREYAIDVGLDLAEDFRKNATIFTIGGEVIVEFGHIQEGYGGFFHVRTPDGQQIDFGAPPPAGALLGLIGGLLTGENES